ncbi:MAG: COX15/CtaA family protein [Candidatus Marinimicrobia bacterium]|jgi:cytochrome c oxidase assembly protein subunit 15|nr:COX15/CtaA family protein [Candidatus Neomarinimicrobiota bacterium]|tara:strand:- start:534 stop:1508 length:975 start_codon:yes stop_codon:yes gene_type:complete
MSHQSVWLRRYSKLIVLATLGLIFLGALVKSFEVGLSVPDWPTTYGYQMFAFPWSDMVGGIFYEHSHRMFATLVGALTVGLTLWLVFLEKRKNVKRLGFSALILVIAQGLLGGLTVMFFLPAIISMIHGITAQTFFLIVIMIAYALSKEFQQKQKVNQKYIGVVLFLFISVYIQLILGAWMRHTESGLAIYDFPKVVGQWLPIFNSSTVEKVNEWRFDMDLVDVELYQLWIHYFHRLCAFIIFVLTIKLGYHYFEDRQSTPRNISLNVLLIIVAVIMQLLLGMYAIWTIKEPILTSLHVVNGATVMGLSFLLLLRTSNTTFLEN